MSRVKFGDVVARVNTKEDRFNTDKDFYVGGEHIITDRPIVTDRGIIAGSTIGPMFYFGFKKGDILFVSRNPHLRKCGMVLFDGICSEKTFVLATKDESVLLQKYLLFVMRSDDFWHYMETHKSGSVNYFINWTTLEEYEFELPSLDEQKKLAKVLWAMVETKEAYRDLLQKTDDIVQARFIEMFADSKYGELSDVSIIIMGQSPDGETYNSNGDGLPFYQGKTEFGDLFIGEPVTWTTDPSRIAEKDDVLLSVRAPVGSTNLATQTCCLGRGLAGIRAVPGKSTYLFILYALRAMEKEIEKKGVGSTFKAINKDIVYSLPIPIVSIDLQDCFVAFAEQADRSKTSLKQSLDALNRIYKKIIAENLG